MNHISFPGLGLDMNINPVAFDLFGKDIYWYGIIISSALFICITLALREGPRFGFKSDDIIDFIFIAVPVSIIGARIYYVAFNWTYYSENPFQIVSIWNGGIAIYGAIIGGILSAVIFSKIKKISMLRLLDFLSPYMILGQAIGRWGNFVNQEAYGSQTNLPWRMEIDSLDGLARIAVHPTFLYESLWNIAIFVVLLLYRNKNVKPGNVFLLYISLYALGRFWIEGLRTDSLMLGEFRVSQLLSAIIVLASVSILIWTKKKRKLNKKYEEKLRAKRGEKEM